MGAPLDEDNGGSTNWGAIGGGLLAGAGVIGSLFSNGNYDPENRALRRYNELTNPESDYYRKLRAMYGKYAANSSPTTDSLLGLARGVGASSGAAQSLAYVQGNTQSMARLNQIDDQVSQDFYRNEQNAGQYLNMDYQMRRNSQDSQGSFFNEVLGIGSNLLAKALF